jgi:hypothetical protein
VHGFIDEEIMGLLIKSESKFNDGESKTDNTTPLTESG